MAGEAREEDEDEEDVLDDDLEFEEFGLALLGDGPLFPLAFFGSCCLRVDMSDSGIVIYCWAPSSLCS